MHGLKQRSPAWQSSLSPKLRLRFPSPAFPTCSLKLYSLLRPSGFALLPWDCGILVLAYLLKDFICGRAGISYFPEVLITPLLVEPLSLHSCPVLFHQSRQFVTSCAQASLRAAVHSLPGPPNTYSHQQDKSCQLQHPFPRMPASGVPEGSGKN